MARSGVVGDWIIGFAASAVGAVALVITLAGSAQAKPASCSATITGCGCVIDATGTYQVGNDLDSTQGLTANNSCIEIAADHVILNLKGFAITGTGAGTGILIRNSAGFAVVQGTDAGAADQAIINSWNVGIEDNANNGVIELFRQIGGNIFNQHGNTKTGILLKTASNTTIDDFNASFNGESGVEIRNGSGNRLLNFDDQQWRVRRAAEFEQREHAD
jgi:parallel beta-helix repeat protein